MPSKPPSVTVVGPFPPLKGGISQHTAHLADSLEREGMKVTRISWAHQYPKALYGRDQVDNHAIPSPDVDWLLSWRNPLSWLTAARRARKTGDVVVLPWVSPVHAPIQFFLLRALSKKTVIFHVHNAEPHERIPLSGPLARLVLRRADHIVCHAKAIVKDLRDLGIDRPTSVVTMAPLLNQESRKLPQSPPFRLLCLGTIRDYKGVDIAIGAADELYHSGHDVEITVAGEIWDDAIWPPAELINAEVPVTTKLRYVSDSEVAQLLEEHHVLVASYRSATQSAVVPLAFAAGRPVVATDVGGLAELVEDGVNGAIARTPSTASVSDAILRAMDNIDTLAAGAKGSEATWADYARVIFEVAALD